jgi:hypothetical protein
VVVGEPDRLALAGPADVGTRKRVVHHGAIIAQLCILCTIES